eukprot:1788315-Amphidinium_carterae.1
MFFLVSECIQPDIEICNFRRPVEKKTQTIRHGPLPPSPSRSALSLVALLRGGDTSMSVIAPTFPPEECTSLNRGTGRRDTSLFIWNDNLGRVATDASSMEL